MYTKVGDLVLVSSGLVLYVDVDHAEPFIRFPPLKDHAPRTGLVVGIVTVGHSKSRMLLILIGDTVGWLEEHYTSPIDRIERHMFRK